MALIRTNLVWELIMIQIVIQTSMYLKLIPGLETIIALFYYLELAVGTNFFLEILTHIRNFMVNNTTIYDPLCGFLILGNW